VDELNYLELALRLKAQKIMSKQACELERVVAHKTSLVVSCFPVACKQPRKLSISLPPDSL
jgi:hypothetical protein